MKDPMKFETGPITMMLNIILIPAAAETQPFPWKNSYENYPYPPEATRGRE